MKGPVKRMKRQATEWEHIFANHVSYKKLECRICKQLSNSTVEK